MKNAECIMRKEKKDPCLPAGRLAFARMTTFGGESVMDVILLPSSTGSG